MKGLTFHKGLLALLTVLTVLQLANVLNAPWWTFILMWVLVTLPYTIPILIWGLMLVGALFVSLLLMIGAVFDHFRRKLKLRNVLKLLEKQRR